LNKLGTFARPEAGVRVEGAGARESQQKCLACPLRKSAFCSSLMDEDSEISPALRKTHGTIEARRNLYRARELAKQVLIVRDGWAFRFAITPGGRRQILSLLLPGDILSSSFLFRDSLDFSAQALTTVHYCAFDRQELQNRIRTNSQTFQAFANACVHEREESDARIADLGRRSAEERIVRFMLDLFERLRERGLAHDLSFAFPVRQQHIADALGLTQVHVSRVVTGLRRKGLIEFSGGTLKITDLQGIKTIIGQQTA